MLAPLLLNQAHSYGLIDQYNVEEPRLCRIWASALLGLAAPTFASFESSNHVKKSDCLARERGHEVRMRDFEGLERKASQL